MCLSYIRKDVCKLIVLHVIEKVNSGISIVFIARLVCTFAWFFLALPRHRTDIILTNKMQQEKEGVLGVKLQRDTKQLTKIMFFEQS